MRPSEAVRLSVEVAWNDSRAALDPFSLPEGEAFAEGRPNQSFDFTQTHTHSDLATELVEVDAEARVRVRPGLFLSGGYRHLEFDDRAPYLYDTSGSIDFYQVGLAWEF